MTEDGGAALLEQVGKRSFRSPAGALLLEHAGRALAELEAAQEALRQLRGVVAGRLRLGTGSTASIHLLPPPLLGTAPGPRAPARQTRDPGAPHVPGRPRRPH